VSHQVQGNVAAGNNHYYSANFFETSVANVAGAATGNGNGLGQFGALGLYTSMGTTANPVFAHEMQCFEWDFSPSATSTAQFVSGIKLVNFAPSAFTVYGTSAFILMATQNPSTQGGFNVGISFGDVEAADNKGFPISPTGKLITALAGTAGTGVDFSAVTFGSGAFKSSDWNISGGGTAPLLAASAAGVGPPTVTTRSAGTKLVLYPQLAGSQVDFAVGIASSVMWFSVPTATAGQGWQFFGGTSLVAQLGGTGILSVNNSYQVLGSQVAGPSQTGWGAGSNGSRAALNGSTATLAQTSAALAQLIIDLTTHGLIGP
jgi:hypothetical protein